MERFLELATATNTISSPKLLSGFIYEKITLIPLTVVFGKRGSWLS